MDRLASQARQLQRQIYASLPFSHRLAVFYLRVASDFGLFGRVMYAEFLRVGVHGDIMSTMPDLDIEVVKRDYRKVPLSAATAFGKIVYQRLYKLIKADHDTREEVAQELMTNWMIRVMDPSDTKAKCRPGIEEKQAFGWVHTVLGRLAYNWNRDESRDHDAMGYANPMPTRETEHGTREIEFADPDVMQALIRDMPRSEWKRLEDELLDVMDTPRDKRLLELKLDGWNNSEIANALGVTDALVGQILKKNKQDITRDRKSVV